MSRLPYLVAAFSATMLAAPALADGIEVHDAYAITARPGAPTGAAFMVIRNHGGAPDRLIGVRSDIAARTELHRHIQGADGMMQMFRIEDGLVLPTEAEIILGRGGDHVMFIGLTEPWSDGQTIAITLIFAVAGEVPVSIVVDRDRLGGAMEAPGHGAMDHGSGG